MRVLVVGAGGVGSSMAAIMNERDVFTAVCVADVNLDRAERAVGELDARFEAARVDASDKVELRELVHRSRCDVLVNACDPRLNPAMFEVCEESRIGYLDMAMNLSEPHPLDPFNKIGRMLGEEQLARHERWRERGILALVGMGVEPGLANVFARYAADHIFDEIQEIGVRDGSNLSVDGHEFTPTFSIWTTIEECLNPPVIWEKGRGFYTTECFSEPEVFHFPAGIGPQECVNVEHEEVILIPRELECNRVTFKYALGAAFIDWLKTFAYLGLDSKEPIRVGGCEISPRDVLAAVLPDPASLGERMHGRTCAGTWVKGIADGAEREVYLYHVADNEQTMREYGHQAVVWQTAVCPVVALELLANGSWKGTGVLGADAFDAVPFLNLLGEYGTHHGMVEMGSGLWPSPKPTGQKGWDRPVRRLRG